MGWIGITFTSVPQLSRCNTDMRHGTDEKLIPIQPIHLCHSSNGMNKCVGTSFALIIPITNKQEIGIRKGLKILNLERNAKILYFPKHYEVNAEYNASSQYDIYYDQGHKNISAKYLIYA